MALQTFTTGQVLTAAQVTALQANDYNQTVSTKTANYVLTIADLGSRVFMNAGGATTITVNTGIFAAGDTLWLGNIGAGSCVVTAGTATVSKFSTASLTLSQYQGAFLYFVSTGAAILYSDSAGASIPLTTKGDLFGYDTGNARIPIGTNNQVLTADSTQALGLKWATPAGGGKVLQVVTAETSTEMSTSSTSLQDTNITLSITPSSATSKVLVMISANTGTANGGGETYCKTAILRGATTIFDQNSSSRTTVRLPAGNNQTQSGYTYLDSPATTSATTYKLQAAAANSSTVYMQRSSATSTITLLEIGA
jgi:hypothetical protein